MPRADGKPSLREVLDSMPDLPTFPDEEARGLLARVPDSALGSSEEIEAALVGFHVNIPPDGYRGSGGSRQAGWHEFAEAWDRVHGEAFPRTCRGCDAHENGPHRFGCSLHGAKASQLVVPVTRDEDGRLRVAGPLDRSKP